ncbi:MAG: hypothetical protein ACKVS8_03395 [Phycisphaerales bacterium]
MSTADRDALFTAAHAAADALRVDPQHPGTARLARALADALGGALALDPSAHAGGLARQTQHMPVVVVKAPGAGAALPACPDAPPTAR